MGTPAKKRSPAQEWLSENSQKIALAAVPESVTILPIARGRLHGLKRPRRSTTDERIVLGWPTPVVGRALLKEQDHVANRPQDRGDRRFRDHRSHQRCKQGPEGSLGCPGLVVLWLGHVGTVSHVGAAMEYRK